MKLAHRADGVNMQLHAFARLACEHLSGNARGHACGDTCVNPAPALGMREERRRPSVAAAAARWPLQPA